MMTLESARIGPALYLFVLRSGYPKLLRTFRSDALANAAKVF
jgi:hypothetical protein